MCGFSNLMVCVCVGFLYCEGVCMCGFCNVIVCMCGFCNVCVCMCGFCNLRLCVYVGFVM